MRKVWVCLLAAVLPVGGDLPILFPSVVAASSEKGNVRVGVVEAGVTQEPAKKTNSGDWRFIVTLESVVGRAGIDFECVTDLSRATQYQLLLFPYNRFLSDDQVKTVQQFIDRGGKTVWFYVCPRSIAPTLGAKLIDVAADSERKMFKQVRFDLSVLPGAPPMMCQDSWNIMSVEPVDEGKVFGTWADGSGSQDPQGRAVNYPAGVLCERGAFFTHVLLNDDLNRKARFLLALIGKFVPEEWDKATAKQFASYGKVGRFESVDALREYAIRQNIPTLAITEAIEAHHQADDLRKSKRFAEALDCLSEAKAKLEAAYYPLFTSKSPELRGVWCSVYASPSWQEMARTLKENGFNAVFAYVGSAGLACYPSQCVPMSEGVKRGRDPLQECVRVAHEWGLQVHVWYIAWYLHLATQQTIEELKKANRLQVDATGHVGNWLCPSRPENVEMVKNALLELARNYDIDGIHFDYIRYPNQNYCFCDFCKEQFQSRRDPNGKDSGIAFTDFIHDVTQGDHKDRFEAWRREQITRLVREVSVSARQIKPNIKISAAVFGGFASARHAQAQDTVEWATQGYVDFLCPMNYTNDLQQLEKLTSQQVQTLSNMPAPSHKVPLVVGLGVFSDSSCFDSPASLVDQIDHVRQLGADGFVLFRYNADMANRFLPALRLGVTKADATIPWEKVKR